jgi:hypothetical protein
MGKLCKKVVILKELKEIKESLEKTYPDLNVVVKGSYLLVLGTFPVSVDGKIVGRYLIRVEFPPDFPKSFPQLYEESGKIPKIRDRHFDGETGRACMFVHEEWGWLREKYPTIVDFLSGAVNDFLVWQVLFDYHGKDILGARNHGLDGRIDFYKEIFKTDDMQIVIKGIDYLAHEKIKGHWLCYCGSNKKLRNCHFKDIVYLRERIPPKLAREAFQQINKLIAKESQ